MDFFIKPLLELEAKTKCTFVSLIPIYKNSDKIQIYNINKMLGYFRRKLMKFDLPTILANECAAGRIYEQLDMSYISPTINTNVSYEDFIKLCQNPREYLVPITEEMYWKYKFSGPTANESPCVPAVKIKDIEVFFAHSNSLEEAQIQWDFLVRHVNFDRLIYVLVDSNGAVPYKIMRDFYNLYGEKMIFYYTEMFNFPVVGNILYSNRKNITAIADALENNFDMVGWLNREYL